jgi:hypothetical protein
MLKKKTLLDQVARQIYEAETMLLQAEGELENAQLRRDALVKRVARLKQKHTEEAASEKARCKASMTENM